MQAADAQHNTTSHEIYFIASGYDTGLKTVSVTLVCDTAVSMITKCMSQMSHNLMPSTPVQVLPCGLGFKSLTAFLRWDTESRVRPVEQRSLRTHTALGQA